MPLGAYEHGAPARTHGGESGYVLALRVVSEALALLSLGLVRPWGEVFPRWLPLLGGRRVPPSFAVGFALLVACYVPLLLGGPLLLAITVAYHRRRD